MTLRGRSAVVPHILRTSSRVVPHSFRSRSVLVCVGNGMEGNGREWRGREEEPLPSESEIVEYLTRETPTIGFGELRR